MDLYARVAQAVDAVTSLDRRIVSGLRVLDRIERMADDLERLVLEGVVLVHDLRTRLPRLDDTMARLDRVLRDLESVDRAAVAERMRRLEDAIYNIEKATVTAGRKFDGIIESLPGRMSDRIERLGHESTPLPHDEEIAARPPR